MARDKILIAAALSDSALGGPATYVRRIVAGLRRENIVVECVHMDPSLPFFPRYAAFFSKIFRSAGSAGIVFAQDPSLSGFPAMIVCMIRRKPLIVRVPGDFAWEYARGKRLIRADIDRFQSMSSHRPVILALRAVQRAVCRRSARIIVPSGYLKRLVLGWGADPEKISVIPNTAPSAPPPSRMREPLRFFSAGRFVSWKHFDALISTFSAFHKRFPEALLVIAGDGPCRSDLELHAAACGAGGAVHFTGLLGSHAMALEYARASCFTLVSEYEGMSHVILEAMAHGLPIIVSDAGGNPEIIHDGVNGLLVPVRDPAALLAAFMRFARDPHAAVPHPGILRPALHTEDSQVRSLMRILSETAS